MATWEDVSRIANSLPEVIESGHDDDLQWRVRDKGFAWARPLRKADYVALGDAAPKGPILCARIPHSDLKDALIAEDPNVYLTTPHFNGYPAILVQLEHISTDELAELLVEAWLVQAPKRLAAQYRLDTK